MFMLFKCLQIEANSEFVNKKRTTIQFLPNDPAAASFLEVWTSVLFSLIYDITLTVSKLLFVCKLLPSLSSVYKILVIDIDIAYQILDMSSE